MDVYKQLWERCHPLLQAFHSDLEVDQSDIKSNAGVPFIHWTRKSGTDLVMLESVAVAENRRVQIIGTAKYHLNPCIPDLLILRFDGKELREITAEQAYEIARRWAVENRKLGVITDN